LQHREAGPPATAELFSDLLSNITYCALWRSVFATAIAIHPAFQRNTLAECHRPGSVGPQPVAALHSSSKSYSDYKQQRRRRLALSRRYTAHEYLGIAHVTATFFDTYSPASGCALCAPRAIFARKRISTASAKAPGPVVGVVFDASIALFRCPGGRNTGTQET
jgi:hypothetical protein